MRQWYIQYSYNIQDQVSAVLVIDMLKVQMNVNKKHICSLK